MLSHHLLRLPQKLRRYLLMQLPHDVHGPASGMADVIRRTEEGIRRSTTGVALGFPDEKQHMAATGLMVDIPLAGGRIGAGGGLALPVERKRIINTR